METPKYYEYRWDYIGALALVDKTKTFERRGEEGWDLVAVTTDKNFHHFFLKSEIKPQKT